MRMVFKATVVNLEVKKPAGKWEKISGEAYGKVVPDEDGQPQGLGFERNPELLDADARQPRPAGVRGLQGIVRSLPAAGRARG